MNVSPEESVGNAGCPMHPQSHVQNKKAHEVVTVGSPEQPGIPARNGFTAYFALSLVIGSHCERKRSNPSRREQNMDCFVACAPRNDAKRVK
jgi:hypothetical protein